MALNSYKSQLAMARAQKMKAVGKFQALQNFYGNWTDERSRDIDHYENQRSQLMEGQTEADHKTNLAVARQRSAAARTASTIKQGVTSYRKIATSGGIRAPIEALKLAHYFRQKIKEHDNSPYWIAFVFAIIVDIADITWLIGLCLKIFLFYFLWGKGTWKVKIVCRIIVLLDCIPFIGWLPLSTIAVLYAWRKSSKEAKAAKKGVEGVKKDLKGFDNEVGKYEPEYADDYDDAYAQAA